MTSLFHSVPFDWRKGNPKLQWRNLAEYMTGEIQIYSRTGLNTLRGLRRAVAVTPVAGTDTYRDYFGTDPRHYLVTPGAYSWPVQYLYIAVLTNLTDIVRQHDQPSVLIDIPDPDTGDPVATWVPGDQFFTATAEFLLDDANPTTYNPLSPPSPLNP